MKDLSVRAFNFTVEKIIAEKLDFVLISGDIFNTALPPIDKVKEVTQKLRQLKEAGIPVYIIAGSHDFSPSGKTMLDVLEHAGLWRNVVKGEVCDGMLKLSFTIDLKTGAKITGMLGRKGMLDRVYYENLCRENLESEEGYKIFLFHTALSEFKPAEMMMMEAHPLSLLPKGFNYYAGGHVHYVFSKEEPYYGMIAYPGPLFPNNFAELEKLGCGSFNIVTVDGEKTMLQRANIQLHPVVSIGVDARHKTPAQVADELSDNLATHFVENALVTIRIEGVLSQGKPQSIQFDAIFGELYKRGAYFVMKNTTKLAAMEFEEIKVDAGNVDNVEDKVISEHIGKSSLFSAEEEKRIIYSLLHGLSLEKAEGERISDFEERVIKDAEKIVPLQ